MHRRLLVLALVLSACRCPGAPSHVDAGPPPLEVTDAELGCYLERWNAQLVVRRSLRERFDQAVQKGETPPVPSAEERARLETDPGVPCSIPPERATRLRELLVLVGPTANDPAKLADANAQARGLFGQAAVDRVNAHLQDVGRVVQLDTEESLELMRRAQQRNQPR